MNHKLKNPKQPALERNVCICFQCLGTNQYGRGTKQNYLSCYIKAQPWKCSSPSSTIFYFSGALSCSHWKRQPKTLPMTPFWCEEQALLLPLSVYSLTLFPANACKWPKERVIELETRKGQACGPFWWSSLQRDKASLGISSGGNPHQEGSAHSTHTVFSLHCSLE